MSVAGSALIPVFSLSFRFDHNRAMMWEQIIDEVERLPAPDRMEIVQRLIDLIAPSAPAGQEQELAEAIDEADEGELVDGPDAFAPQRRCLRGA
jgi:hypothetical protein